MRALRPFADPPALDVILRAAGPAGRIAQEDRPFLRVAHTTSG
ncbi:hypothetical protein ACIHCQ_03595 [Streptomyces sp. NPDC052236]